MKNLWIYKGTKWGKTTCQRCGKNTTVHTLRNGARVEMFQRWGEEDERTSRGKFNIRICPACESAWMPEAGDEFSWQVGHYIFTFVVQAD